MADAIGDAILLEDHGYRPLSQLSSSMCNIVLIVHRISNVQERFVVKTFALGSLDAPSQKRALHEIQLLRELEHPNVIRYVESWWTGPARLSVVMEYAEDGDLRAPRQAMMHTGGRLPEVLVMRWLGQLLQALRYIHSRHVIHRDLKSSNVFLKDQWCTCLLGDFGISTVLDSTNFADSSVGTPAYMAPELVRNERYTSAVDLWATGVIVYELMSLRLPFMGSSLAALVFQIAFNALDEGPILDAGYSSPLVNLLRQLLVKDPSLRPTAKAILEDDELWSYRQAALRDEASRQAALELFAGQSRHEPSGIGIAEFATEESWGGAMPLSGDTSQGTSTTFSFLAESSNATVTVLADAMLDSGLGIGGHGQHGTASMNDGTSALTNTTVNILGDALLASGLETAAANADSLQGATPASVGSGQQQIAVLTSSPVYREPHCDTLNSVCPISLEDVTVRVPL